ncbi:glutamine dumper 2-like protein [Tanacetum coccineum]
MSTRSLSFVVVEIATSTSFPAGANKVRKFTLFLLGSPVTNLAYEVGSEIGLEADAGIDALNVIAEVIIGKLSKYHLVSHVKLALVILACSQRRRRLAGENGGDIESGGDNEKSIKAVHNGGDAADVSPKMVVIMAGDEVPTYLATPSEVAVGNTHVSN